MKYIYKAMENLGDANGNVPLGWHEKVRCYALSRAEGALRREPRERTIANISFDSFRARFWENSWWSLQGSGASFASCQTADESREHVEVSE